MTAHNLETRNVGNQWVQHRRGQFGGGLSQRGHQSGACLGGTFKDCAKGRNQNLITFRKTFRNFSSLNRSKGQGNCASLDILQHLPVLSWECTKNACLLGIGRPESARPELAESCVENVAAKLLGVNSLADLSHLPVMECPTILHSILYLFLQWFLGYHSFPFFPILSLSVPFFPTLVPFFAILLTSFSPISFSPISFVFQHNHAISDFSQFGPSLSPSCSVLVTCTAHRRP